MEKYDEEDLALILLCSLQSSCSCDILMVDEVHDAFYQMRR